MTGSIRRFVLKSLLLTMGTSMALSTTPASANQRPRPVLALVCEPSSAPLCQALFQALAQVAPTHAIRFNPTPSVPGAVEVTLHRSAAGDRLSWHDGKGATGSGAEIRATPSPETQARALLAATPDLTGTLATGKVLR